MQHTTYNIQYTTYNIQHATYKIQHTTYNIQHTTYNIQHTTYNMQQNSKTVVSPKFHGDRTIHLTPFFLKTGYSLRVSVLARAWVRENILRRKVAHPVSCSKPATLAHTSHLQHGAFQFSYLFSSISGREGQQKEAKKRWDEIRSI